MIKKCGEPVGIARVGTRVQVAGRVAAGSDPWPMQIRAIEKGANGSRRGLVLSFSKVRLTLSFFGPMPDTGYHRRFDT